jgi:RNA polymerase sigma-70 factor (ECF subfamily)
MSLLGRLRASPADEAVWCEFVDRYGRKIYDWCGAWRLQDADARDVTQTVLTTLAVKMRTFTYDPSLSFRGWLRTITENASIDVTRRRARLRTNCWERLQAVQARDDLCARLEAEFDLELLAEATARVRQRVEPRTWEAFQLTAHELLPGAVVAQRLGMNPSAVFRAKSMVQKMLRNEIQKLEQP